ncbi:unnamed protein product [Adineta steineri]|uniref:Uncharacterized protein n=1 Tax=Adineta steineri TaxID=433720 RepID=A0A818M944_9BILA|nr:unnamed protein product [Adineta steineri]
MFILFLLSILHLTISQDIIAPHIFSDCKHLILPARCQCYHSGHESQLRCLKSELHSLPKLPNNMRWNALDFSYNYITSVDNYVFADIYVETISLKSNYLRRIEITAFDHIKNLKELFINNNQLKELFPQTLASPGSSLEIFDVSYNPFQYLDIGEILLNLPMLKQFHLVSCHLNNTSIYTLTKLIPSPADLHNQTSTRHGQLSLEILDLSYNNLTTICHNLFDGLYNLIELRLNHNSIRLIDNNFLHTFSQIKIINLAHNLLEQVPRLSSRSLEILNFSTNHIHYIGDYFASQLRSIRIIDLDHNHHLNNTSIRAFCFLNILTLEKLTFRSTNLISLDTFGELLCRLINVTHKVNTIDINNNVNLKCDCTLIQFQNYLNNFKDLTCTQHGQDRYYISNPLNQLSNCQYDFCLRRQQQAQSDDCNHYDAERVVYEGTCKAKLIASEERKKMKLKSMSTTTTTTITMTTLIDLKFFENITESRNLTKLGNSTKIQIEKKQISNLISINRKSFILLIICFLFLLL